MTGEGGREIDDGVTRMLEITIPLHTGLLFRRSGDRGDGGGALLHKNGVVIPVKPHQRLRSGQTPNQPKPTRAQCPDPRSPPSPSPQVRGAPLARRLRRRPLPPRLPPGLLPPPPSPRAPHSRRVPFTSPRQRIGGLPSTSWTLRALLVLFSPLVFLLRGVEFLRRSNSM